MYPTSRNKNLDFLRGVAVLLVIAGHFLKGYISTHLGWSGVDLFFVLSGFFVSGILIREYQRNGRVRPLRFLLRRGFKIWPLFYSALVLQLIYFFIKGQYPGNRPVLNEFFFIQNYFHGFMNVTWSLGSEEQFYLLLALFFYFFLSLRSLRNLPLFCIIIMALCLVARLINYYYWNGQYDPYVHFYPLYFRFDSLCAGILISYYYHTEPLKLENWVNRYRPILLALATVLAIPLALYPFYDMATFTYGFTCTYAFYAILVLLFLFPGRRQASMGNNLNYLIRGIAWVGFYSYSIYLFHYFVGSGILSNLRRSLGNEIPVPFEFGLVLGACILAGYIFSRAIEIPFLRWRDRLYPPEESRSQFLRK